MTLKEHLYFTNGQLEHLLASIRGLFLLSCMTVNRIHRDLGEDDIQMATFIMKQTMHIKMLTNSSSSRWYVFFPTRIHDLNVGIFFNNPVCPKYICF